MKKNLIAKATLFACLIAYPTLCYLIDSIYMFIVTCLIVGLVFIITTDMTKINESVYQKELALYLIQISSLFMFIAGIVALELFLAFVSSVIIFATIIIKSKEINHDKTT